IEEVGKEFGALTGREYGYFDEFMLEDAELVIVALGSTAGTAKETARRLRAEGVKAGVLKIRMFRPFPGDEIAAALAGSKAVAVLDRSISFGLEGGPLFHEMRSHAFGTNLTLVPYVYGLGGRDINVSQLREVYGQLAEHATGAPVPKEMRFVGVRSDEACTICS
ncbi:transketolase C-terminal domain-containing protein, partial [Planctomycetota bacterium]